VSHRYWSKGIGEEGFGRDGREETVQLGWEGDRGIPGEGSGCGYRVFEKGSRSSGSNGTFQVLIFCHKISLDMFKNLKNRYIARVQSYYNSLLEKARRGESVPGGLTGGKLSDIEFELEEFSNKLDKLIGMSYEP